jgi:hypothetical protein
MLRCSMSGMRLYQNLRTEREALQIPSCSDQNSEVGGYVLGMICTHYVMAEGLRASNSSRGGPPNSHNLQYGAAPA